MYYLTAPLVGDKMAGPEAAKVLGMLWKQAGVGSCIGLAAAASYYSFVAKSDMKKIETYYAKQDKATGSS